MPRSPQRKEETRQRIVAAASRRFRAAGLEGAGVAEIMAAAGLTHGGFYAHFGNKADLVLAALAAALAETRAMWLAELEGLGAADAYRLILGRYLCRAHRDDPAGGCAIAALASELARQDAKIRGAFERDFIGTLEALELHVPERDGLSRRERALATMALALGGLLLARMVASAELSDAVLLACRRAALRALGPTS
ncbi:MAG TPA: TetR family transcriptional regulator [Alphaproteobacteria bacterium]|nr:TetR family transcriptional regulator [Alphaproteobacteria bacterium]